MNKKITALHLSIIFIIGFLAYKMYPEDPHAKWHTHRKQYQLEDIVERRTIYEQNIQFIEQHNKKQESFTLTDNEFSHLTPKEYAHRLNNHMPRIQSLNQNETIGEEPFSAVVRYPTGFDWRTKNVVAPIQNQGSCGSCYAFGAVSVVESYRRISGLTTNVEKLSEQYIVDWSLSKTPDRSGNWGCEGGFDTYTYPYIIKNGIPRNDNYSYTAQNYPSGIQPPKVIPPQFLIKNVSNYYMAIGTGTENKMKEALCNGPVSIAVNAGLRSFSMYKSGVYNDRTCSSTINHEMVAVGWGKDSRYGEYWIVRNSWGSGWGENGYIRIALGRGICGIGKYYAYPKMSGTNTKYKLRNCLNK